MPTSSTRRVTSRWRQLFIVLVGLSIFMGGAALWGTKISVGNLQEVLEQQQKWVRRQGQYQALGLKLVELNDVSNNVLSTKNVDRELQDLQRIWQELEVRHSRVRQELMDYSGPMDLDPQIKQMDELMEHARLMRAEAQLILANVFQDQPEQAVQRLSRLDQPFNEAMRDVNGLVERSQTVRKNMFDSHQQTILLLSRALNWGGGALLLAVAGIAVYGNRLVQSY